MIVDGADNFPTRYLVNDASVWHGIPVVHGSIYRFEGQVTVFNPRRGPVLPLPLPHPAAAGARSELRRGRRARRPAGDRRLAAGERGAEARCSASATRSRAGCSCSTRSGRRSTRSPCKRDPTCPVCGEHPTITEYVDYVEFCQGVRAMTKVRIPPTLRNEVGGERELIGEGETVREVLEDLSGRYPGARGAAVRERRPGAVRERLRRRRGRPHARRARDPRQRQLDDSPAGHGRWVLSTPHSSVLDLVGNTPLVELSRFAPGPVKRLREARGARTRPARSRTASRRR